ncbi:MAG: SO_0444 family Cu/Zn efflux transporter [Muribaculaceae bacterium]|nr:SO_0444 family Cu/Zn efflux transporter [Muribaculaceae bacterium]
MEMLYSLINILNEMSPYILLGFIVAGLLHVFVRPSTMARHLSGSGWRPVVKAAMLGVPLPLCSCGVLPAAVSLRRQGASKAASTSFLIATPQTGVDSIAATYSLLGLPFAIIRPVAALAGAVFGGLAVDRFDPERGADACTTGCAAPDDADERPKGFFRRLVAAVHYGLVDMVASVGKWLVIGLVVAALITVFVPDDLFVELSRYPLLAMLAVVAVAVPMYICATGSIPIALSLMLKGLSPGIAFVMLMAGPAANFASVMILRRTQGTRATAIYIGSVVLTAMVFGLLIDLLLPAAWFVPRGMAEGVASCHVEFSWFPTLCSVLLVALLVYTSLRNRFNRQNINTKIDMNNTFTVKGMACAHCKATVEKAVSAIDGVDSVAVDLGSGKVEVAGNADAAKIAEAIRLAGFEVVD